jgi:hypothetical protein
MKKEELTNKVKQLIKDDMSKNIVPCDAESYETLCKYVDANMYFINAGYDYNGTEKDHEFLNEQIDIIDQWLKNW